MAVAFDVSFRWQSVTPADVLAADGKGVLVYSGPARPSDAWCDQMRSAGLEVVWIWEEAVDSALHGYDAGWNACYRHEQRIPAGELSYVVACDLNNGALAGRDVTAFLKGWNDSTREPVFGQYGSSDAIEQGMTVGGKLQRFWGVVNWSPPGKPNNHPDNIAWWENAGAHLVQLIGDQIPGTDTNLILKPDWHTTATHSGDDDDMPLYSQWPQAEKDALVGDIAKALDFVVKGNLSDVTAPGGLVGVQDIVAETLAVARKDYNQDVEIAKKVGAPVVTE